MLFFSCRGIKKSYGDKDVLKGIDLDINEGERIGIVGVNGAGKTTLAGLVFGSFLPDEGYVEWGRREAGAGYLLQSSSCLFKNVGEGYISNDYDAEDTGNLSGGERTRLSLKTLMAGRPELLILDEPTNHLDFAGVEWLAGELSAYAGTVIIISHDRYFMDMAVDRIIEIDNGLAKSYGGNYTYYRQKKKLEYQEQLHQYTEQEKRKDLLEAEIAKVRMWAEKSHREAGKKGKMAENKMGAKEYYRIAAKRLDKRAGSKLKRLQKMEHEGIKKPLEDISLNFVFDNAGKHGKRILEVKGIEKGYGGRTLFTDSSFYMLHGDRIGIVGPNGCGKTTLLKLITGEESPDGGEVWMSATAGSVYISQDVNDLEPDKRPLDLLEDIQFHDYGKAHHVFASLGIDASMLVKKLGLLSQGERMRVKLALAILEGSGFLILDEPTNHLDLFSRERLEEALDEYGGTILMVSHDRYMLERVCEKLLVFEDGWIKTFYGRFGEYMYGRSAKTSKSSEKKLISTDQERLLIENRISALLGRLSSISAGNPEYENLDREFNELTRRKRELWP